MATELQIEMIKKIAFDEFTEVNGRMPQDVDQTHTWADGIIETAEDKGVFTSLLNADLVWHSGKGRDAGVGLTPAGFALLLEIVAQ